jgi:hypothetical protein
VNEIIKKVLSANRNCAYPSDVCDAFYSICIETNCKQFTDGCTSNDLAVIDALQSLADRYGKYISSDELVALLKNKLNAEQLEQSLSILTDTLELFEKHPTSKMYQFRVEIYRRYLRSKKSTLTLGDQFTTKEISIKTNDSDSMVD